MICKNLHWIAPLITGLALAGCTQSEPEPAAPPAAAPAAAPAAPAPVVPPAAAPAAAPSGPAYVADELYVDAEANPDEGPPPLAVAFTSIVEDNTGPYECEWDFGDGSPKEKGLEPKHTYAKEGDFVVLIRCKDSKGLEGETEIDVMAFSYE